VVGKWFLMNKANFYEQFKVPSGAD